MADEGAEGSGRTAVVTGAGRGIGRAIAEELSNAGFAVACLDVRAELAEETALALQAGQRSGRRALALAADVTDRAALEVACATVCAELGGVDALVNNAGLLLMDGLLTLTEEDWDRIMAVNVKGVLLATQVFTARMIEQGRGGAVVNISSIGGKIGFTEQAHYSASKAAVLSLTRVAAMELSGHGIRVNAVCPGAIDTDLFARCLSWSSQHLGVPEPELLRQWLAPSLLKRLIAPAEVARVVAFLASDAASAITGTSINVDGGVSPW